VRAVLDPNVLVSAILSRRGPPGQIVSRWLGGELELIVSELLLRELARALEYPKLRARAKADEASELLLLLRERAVLSPDPAPAPQRSTDPNDDYLLALAESERAVVVSGDQDLIGLADEFPIFTPRAFLETLETQR
jgi:putative PIN family toxin of toxin-antitoxin system